MPSLYPGAPDVLENPTSSSNQSVLSHSDQHADANDAIEAIQAELGTDPAGSLATVAARLDGVGFGIFNVKDYGAVGDGVADDTAEIQAAIAAVPAAGGVVYLPAGNYKVSATLTVDAHSVTLRGAGVDATKITATVATFNVIKLGNRQSSGVMRNHVRLEDLAVVHAGGASTVACVMVDGLGYGSVLRNVETNDGGYGFRLKDLDRVSVVNCHVHNPRTAGFLQETGLENTWGTVSFRDCSSNLSDTNSTGWLFDTAAEQGSPNPFDRVSFINCLFFSTSGLTGTTGLKMTVGARSMVIIGSLFENNVRHIDLVGTTDLTLISTSFMYPLNSTDIIRFQTNAHFLTSTSCTYQQSTNGFNASSGFPHITFLGRNRNNGNITNLLAGTFGSKQGTDTVFIGQIDSAVTTIGAVIDGGGSTITTGIKGDIVVDFACTIQSVTLLADQSGSIVVDIWADTYANYPPTDADSITAAAPPTITTATKSQDTTLSDWTTAIAAGSTLRFNVDSVTTITRVTLLLKVLRT